MALTWAELDFALPDAGAELENFWLDILVNGIYNRG
jgi:hypothetical protein